ncbi:MAG: hypothetical protein M9916_11595 [Crocinitomicaceae bacterium]|nr:hypothetical protein [Crocinitomicaceae bacterium]
MKSTKLLFTALSLMLVTGAFAQTEQKVESNAMSKEDSIRNVAIKNLKIQKAQVIGVERAKKAEETTTEEVNKTQPLKEEK